MTDLELLLYALIALAVVFVLFWLDYRRSDCAYGGAGSGRNNWQDADD